MFDYRGGIGKVAGCIGADEVKMAVLDAIDLLLVELLQKDARMPQAVLAKRVGLAASSVNERIRKLEQQGFVTGYHARVSPEAMGYELLAFVYVAWSNPKTEAKFLARVANEATIVEVHHVTGVWNYVLKVRVKNTRMLEKLLAAAKDLASQGLVELSGDHARATEALVGRSAEFHAVKEKVLDELHAKHAFERA